MEHKFNTEIHDLIGKLQIPKSGFKRNEDDSKIQAEKISF
jgi:hypothetical protein